MNANDILDRQQMEYLAPNDFLPEMIDNTECPDCGCIWQRCDCTPGCEDCTMSGCDEPGCRALTLNEQMTWVHIGQDDDGEDLGWLGYCPQHAVPQTPDPDARNGRY